jgi:hypothetical protein
VFIAVLDTMIRMGARRQWRNLVLILAVGLFTGPIFALELTEPTAAAHAYPGLCDINGRKLADGELRQWIENERLNVVITYKISRGRNV